MIVPVEHPFHLMSLQPFEDISRVGGEGAVDTIEGGEGRSIEVETVLGTGGGVEAAAAGRAPSSRAVQSYCSILCVDYTCGMEGIAEEGGEEEEAGPADYWIHYGFNNGPCADYKLQIGCTVLGFGTATV